MQAFFASPTVVGLAQLLAATPSVAKHFAEANAADRLSTDVDTLDKYAVSSHDLGPHPLTGQQVRCGRRWGALWCGS